MKIFDRKIVISLLKKAFDYTANHDYANGFAIYEEDIRNCLYYNIRRPLDFDINWTIFSDIVIKIGDEARKYRTDLVFFSKDDDHKFERIELLVELNTGRLLTTS